MTRALSAIASFVLFFCIHSIQANQDRPNILWVVSEDNSPEYIGAYGNPLARTPNIDRLAQNGIVFHRAYTAPVCATSRSSIITGCYASSLGTQQFRSERPLPDGVRFFPELLREAGYYTSNNSKTDYNTSTPWDAAWDESSHHAHWRNRAPGQAFFSVFNFHESHASRLLELRPLQTDPKTVRVPEYLPDTPAIRNDLARYHDCVSRADSAIGEILAQLESDGLANDTIVFYYSDHGGAVMGSKRFLNEAGTRAALIAYFPPKYAHLAPSAPGSESNELIHFIDLAPTTFSLTGLPPLQQFQGRAFAGPERNPAPEFTYMYSDRMDERYNLSRAVTDGRYRYIRNYYPDRPWGQWSDSLWRPAGAKEWELYYQRQLTSPEQSHFFEPAAPEELYEIDADPDNVRNLANDPKHQEALKRLRKALRQHLLDVDDAGFLPEPLMISLAKERSPRTVTSDATLYPLPEILDRLDATQLKIGQPKPINPESAPEVLRYWLAATSPHTQLEQFLTDPEPSVRIAAAEALLRHNNTDQASFAVFEEILDANQGKTELQVFALDALVRTEAPLTDKLAIRLGEFASIPTFGGTDYFLARLSRYALSDHRRPDYIRNRYNVPTIFTQPYPNSQHLAGIEIDWSTHERHAQGSDNFQLTWAEDDHLYGAWGDGGGFHGNNRRGRVGLGVARIEGQADSYEGFNVWGGHEAHSPATFDGKSWGMIAIPDTLYMWTVPDVPDNKNYRNHYEYTELARSRDFGATWEKADWRFHQSELLAIPTFLNFGKANTGVPSRMDGYIYSYFIRPEFPNIEQMGPKARGLTTQTPGTLYLARARPGELFASKEAYEFFAGLDAKQQPIWGPIDQKQPVFEDANGVGWCVSAAYHPEFDRVLLTTEHGLSHKGLLGIFDAPNPWGPWTTLEYYQPDAPFGLERPGSEHPWSNNVFFASFVTKWFEGDQFVLSFTGSGLGKNNDSMNTVRGRFKRRE